MSDRRPKFRADVHARAAGDELLILDSESGVELVDDCLSASMAPLLDGSRTLPEIIAQVAGGDDTLDAIHAVSELIRRGLVVGAEAETPSRISIRAVDDTDPKAFEPFLRPYGFTEAGANPGIAIVIASDYLAPELQQQNQDALASGLPWMLVKPRGEVLWIGPVFRPGVTACWLCMAERMRSVRAAWRLPASASSIAGTPAEARAFAFAAGRVAHALRQCGDTAELTTLDLRTLRQQTHAIVRRSDCAACGDPSIGKAFVPFVLESRRKSFVLDGGHRAAPPEETWARYEHLISPLTGVVHSVEPAAGEPSLHVYVARHNYRRESESLPARSLGKGMTAAQARTGALCEALERYSGLFRGDETLLRSSFVALRDTAIHPNRCLGISERQYATREKWNRAMPPVMWIAERFDEEIPVDWTPAWSLTNGNVRHVAAAYCYYGHPDAFCRADSNGNAAGTCLEDAVLQGLVELIERDAVAIWWYNRVRRPGVVLDAPHARAMQRFYAEQGWRLWVLDLTTDLGVPVFAAVARSTDDPDSLLAGFGAHLDPQLAVTRAITELSQLFAASAIERVFTGELPDSSFLEPHGWTSLDASAVQPSDDLREDVLTCVDLLRARDLEVLVLDQTRDDTRLPVVKVIVPGLRHFRPRFAPGRLYDVPERLGWLERPLCEDELNSAHLTI